MTERRSELKRWYRENPPAMGIFQIRNLANGRVLIGSSPNLPGRLNRSRFQLEMGSHPNRELQADWQALGADSFAFEILDELKPVEDGKTDPAGELKVLLAMWMEKVEPYGERGYNPRPPDD